MGIFEIESEGFTVSPARLFFVEDRLGNDILLAGPIAQVLHAAALAAKGKIPMDRRVRLRFANRAFMSHAKVFSLFSVLRSPAKYSLPEHSQRRAGGNPV